MECGRKYIEVKESILAILPSFVFALIFLINSPLHP